MTDDIPVPPVARLVGVSHLYGKVQALRDVTLDLPAGRMIGLIGPDGVGKSTLMGLIAGAKKMQAGQVEALGGDMAGARHRADAGRRIAFMPQGLGKISTMTSACARIWISSASFTAWARPNATRGFPD